MVFDNTIHGKSIARQFQPSDFIADRMLFDEAHRDLIVSQAVGIAQTGFISARTTISRLRGKPVYQLVDLADLLVIRHLTANIRRVTSVKQDDRRFIVECLKSLLEEGTSFKVFKFDVESFYESIDPSQILERLKHDPAFSGQSVRALTSFFAQMAAQQIDGVPRGLALSATLSEYLMRDFDSKISENKEVLYFSRFVDDIIIISPSSVTKKNIWKFASSRLPAGLAFNSKSRDYTFALRPEGNAQTVESSFSFLGYEFYVSQTHRLNRKFVRDVYLDIAPSKVKRLKTRLVRSVMQYNADQDYENLLSRVKLLTGNFRIVDRRSGRSRTSGIYYNYPLVDSGRSQALPQLDKFLCNLICSSHLGNVHQPDLSRAQRREILGLTFWSGFQSKRFFHFSGARLAELKSCWAYA